MDMDSCRYDNIHRICISVIVLTGIVRIVQSSERVFVCSHHMELDRVEDKAESYSALKPVVPPSVIVRKGMFQFWSDIACLSRISVDAETISHITTCIRDYLEIPQIIVAMHVHRHFNYVIDRFFCTFYLVGVVLVLVILELVSFLGAKFACVDTGFGENKPVDVVIRPEDVMLVSPEEGTIQGEVSHLIFKGVHYEMEVMANGYEWLVHSTNMFPVGTKVGIKVDPFNIQIMNKPVSEDEEAVGVEE